MSNDKNYTVKRLGGNLFEVYGEGKFSGEIVLVSYDTPVACFDALNSEFVRTDVRWSRSTESHLSDWHSYTGKVSQAKLDELLKSMTGNERLTAKVSAAERLGRKHRTLGVKYDQHTEPGDSNLVVPVYRRN